ncbi:MAG: radical SAM protein [Clostridiales bacterium]|nr:radical SAM protein [Clostridiales bacterium]
MIKIQLGAVYNINDYDELARMFLPRGEYELVFEKAPVYEGVPAKLKKARGMYAQLAAHTGRKLPWGVLTGVKPTKLFSQLAGGCSGSETSGAGAGMAGRTCIKAPDAGETIQNEYLVSREKALLLKRIYEREKAVLPAPCYGDVLCAARDGGAGLFERDRDAGLPAGGAVAVYIGIPFCPTRCAYCTFTSGVGSEKQMAAYLAALYNELSYVAEGMRRRGMWAESIYVGGGTPTALTPPMLDELLGRVDEAFLRGGLEYRAGSGGDLEYRAGNGGGLEYRAGSGFGQSAEGTAGAGSGVPEFTVEAGRPDTITYEKALLIARGGACRVSVNPQTMNDETLERIGRRHTAADTRTAFENVRAAGIKAVNADIIAGLPGEGPKDFRCTLEETLRLAPENVTVHTLALKKGSAMRESDPVYAYSGRGAAGEMLRIADEGLSASGMGPYYLYRQKQTVENLENTGYAQSGAECVYNMRMMQEKQTVVALGAGAVSKLYFPAEDRIERIFNMADTGLYIERICEMIERKRKLFELEREL